ncbi:MAG TPA: hypothetical protein VIJ66_13110 [Solirubrobacteraceae bacterium]
MRQAPLLRAVTTTISVAPLTALLAAALAACVCLPAGATATPAVSLHAAFHPERPGHTTTVELEMRIDPGGAGAGEIVPPPLTEVSLSYPAGLDIALSGLGIDTCSVATLEAAGPSACPADSWMGEGEAMAELPIHHEPFREDARIAILRGPEVENHLVMLFYVYGETAVSATLILTGRLLEANRPFGGRLAIAAPLVQSLPEGPDLTVGELSFVLGPAELTYYERVHDKVVPYTPNGIRLPEHCPRGGYPFAIELGFLGGAHAAASTAVACPKRARAPEVSSRP